MIITYHREKIINAIIYFAKNTQYCGKTKLLKLLYFLDFRHFKQTGKSVTGFDYYAWDMGPVPRDFYNELEDMKPDLKDVIKVLSKEGFQKYIPKKKFNGEYFSKREMRLLEEISYIFKDAKAPEMIESIHLANEPWDKTFKAKGRYEKIDYMLSIDNIDGSLSGKEALERKEEISETHSIFGVS